MNLNLEPLQAAIAADDADKVGRLLAESPALATASGAQEATLIMSALYQGKHKAAAALAAAKPELDVFEAAALGSIKRLATLLQDEPGCIAAVAPDGFPALGLAVFFAQPASAAMLLAAGANARQAADNTMAVAPIHAACTHQDEDLACRLVHLLLAFGADPNQRQQAGWTPLHAAAHRNQPRLIALLRLAGADPTLANDAGLSALDMARKETRAEALQALQ